MSRRSTRLAPLLLIAAAATVPARAARADEPLPLVHPLYVHLPDAPEEDALRRAFTAAVTRYKLGPVEVVDVPAPAPPRAHAARASCSPECRSLAASSRRSRGGLVADTPAPAVAMRPPASPTRTQ